MGPELNLIPAPVVTLITAWLALPGQLFLALIQMIVVPLVIASIVRGLAANRDPRALKQIGMIALGFILLTTIIGTTTGIGLGQLIKPGLYINSELLSETVIANGAPLNSVQTEPPSLSAANMPDMLASLFPKNPMAPWSRVRCCKWCCLPPYWGLH